MWGHATTCGCSLCFCLPRVFQLIREGSPVPGFVGSAGFRLRTVEADLRDELTRLLRQVPLRETPPQVSQAGAPGAPEPPGPVGGADKTVGETSPPVSQAASPAPPEVACPGGLTHKAPPLPPPHHIAPPGALPPQGPVKQEQPEEKTAPTAPGVVSVAKSPSQKKEETSAKASGSRPNKDRSEKRARSAKSRSSRSRKRDRKRRSPDRRRESRSPRVSPNSKRGKEKKRRHERPPEPQVPPRGYRGDRTWWTSEPSYPQHRPQGSGWRGPIPASSHPRWTEGQNKGLTKRAKQELYNRRYQGRRWGWAPRPKPLPWGDQHLEALSGGALLVKKKKKRKRSQPSRLKEGSRKSSHRNFWNWGQCACKRPCTTAARFMWQDTW